MAQPLGMGIFSPVSVAEATKAQRGKVSCHTLRQSPESQSSPLPTPAPEHKPQASLASYAGCGRKGHLPQHPEISTKSQTAWQLVVTWYLMVPGDTKKKVRSSLLWVGGLLFKALQYLPTLIAPGRREERKSTQMGRGVGKEEGPCH